MRGTKSRKPRSDPAGCARKGAASPPPRFVVPAGRRPRGPGSAPRGAGRARARVVERFVAADARGDLVDAASVDADAGRRPDADDLVVRESTTQTTTTTTRTVTMDADGNVVDERETVESNVAGDVPSARAATTATDVAGVRRADADGGPDRRRRRFARENHGVDVGPDELRDLLARTRTRKKYRGVETREWDEREREAGRDDAETENDEGIVALVGNLLRGLLGGDDEKPRAPPARSACSANVVFDKPPTDPEARSRAVAAATAAIPASAAAASGLLARRDAKPQASRGAWRAAKTAADLGESAVSPADAGVFGDARCVPPRCPPPSGGASWTARRWRRARRR